MTARWRFYPELTIEPLIDRAGSETRLVSLAHLDSRTVHRARGRGLTVEQADRYAVALGMHPAELWPTWSELVERDQRAARTAATRKWRRKPGPAELNRERRRSYYADNADYERARERARYDRDRVEILERKRARHHAARRAARRRHPAARAA